MTVTIVGALPADPLWHNQAAYVAILGAVPRVAAASLIAYFVGEFCNSYVLAKYKIRTAGNRMSWRFVISTALGQLIDSGTFVAVAFTGRLSLREMFAVLFTGWAIMVTWEIAALPLTVPLVKALKRTENVDYFDIDTDFNPLHLRVRPITPGDAETSNALSRQQIP